MKRRFWVILTALVLSSALCVSASAMSIFVELPGGEETVTLEVESGDSMDNVREKLAQKDARTAQWWLSYGGSYLAYGRTLGEYNIQKESTLHLNASKEVRVSTKDQVLSAVQDNAVQVVTLDADIRIDRSLRIARALTLDLNGHVLRYGENVRSSVILVEAGGQLTVIDSDPSAKHQFTPNADGLWVLDENGSKTVSGGVITGGTGKDTASPGGMAEYRGGGVYIQTGGSLTMEGGNIVGCTAHDGGGVCAEGTFTMNSGSIVGCLAYRGTENHAEGGGVFVVGGAFAMSGGSIRHCTAYGTPSSGGGVQLNNEGSFTLSGSAEIRACRCIAPSNRARGGGVFVTSGCTFTMRGGSIAECTVQSGDPGSALGGGVYSNGGSLTMEGGSIAKNCTASGGGSFCNEGGTLYANGGEIAGDVLNGAPDANPGRITGAGGTVFSGSVTNCKYDDEDLSVIESGIFTGTVINNASITGGDFSGVKSLTNANGGSASFSVTFDANGGSAVAETATVLYGGTLVAPVTAKTGYLLDGWYNGTVKWNFITDTVKSSMTLRAKWVICDHSGNTARPTCTDSAACTECGETLPALKHDWGAWRSNGNDTHSRVCANDSTHTETDACSGGAAATCRDRSLCAVCGQPYGALDPDAHTNLTVIPAKAPTSGSAGNIEYWHCTGCGKYYKDAAATQEIAAEDTVLPQLPGLVVGPAADTVRVTETENGSIAVSPKNPAKGSTVIITVEPDEGYELDEITVTDKAGNNLKLTDKGDGKYSFTMPSGKVDIDATFKKLVETSPFADVSTDAYYYEAVKWAAENNITGGIGNGLFGPDLTCTRGQIVTFLWRAAGSPEPTALSTFTDVAADAYYAKAVAWAVENGVTTGTGDGKFSPDAPCTRGQAVTFLWRALGQLTGDTASFADVPADSYFAQAVAWAAANGVTTGVGNNRFAPDALCTRAQIVTFLWRAYQGK